MSPWLGWLTTQWYRITPTRLGALIAGALCALLAAPGRWPTRIAALVAALLVLYTRAIFVGYSQWNEWMARHGNMTPYSVVVAINTAVFITIAVLGFVNAARLRRVID